MGPLVLKSGISGFYAPLCDPSKRKRAAVGTLCNCQDNAISNTKNKPKNRTHTQPKALKQIHQILIFFDK